METLAASTRFSGEISERAELLNGAMQLTLDGVAVGAGAAWAIEAALSWRLGRSGAVALDEGDLTLTLGDAELVAILDEGSALLDEETGAVEVDASFDVEGATAVDIEPGAGLRGRFEIDADAWSGEVGLVTGEPARRAERSER